ncbi:YdbL family protein [Idiomarina aminovorans]|uniref:YdbL family protein n=1 Tax=Idiomarina aminovorans TaxID=2914829 RepID=UPI0020066816|nr:YdbL family protein [Idiomarina sp. ATCH4]MCK7458632.1 YdbL family protein [Idiomarina sp. ATCH4]
MKKLTISAFVALLSIAGMTTPTVSYAQELTLQQAMDKLSEAKDKGWVGEQPNGYLGAIKPPLQAKKIAERINEARRKEYVRIAEANDIAVADVELLAGKRAIERTQTGHYVKLDGQWKKKP